jgi:toxin-antitoxin system PIN domain toxin
MCTNTSLFPDVNVWVSLAHAWHPHHESATLWIDPLGPECRIYFCRLTQLGLLRVLTTRSAMGEDVMTQAAAWKVYDLLLQDRRNDYLDEPHGLEPRFRRNTGRGEASPKQWADGYIVAFAEAAGLRLVTFDKALARRTKGSILLTA